MAEKYFGITDKGKQRDNNEDTFIAEPVMKNKFIAAAVIDGVGGYEGGELAAAIAKETILIKLNDISGPILPSMVSAIVEANQKIFQEKIQSGKNQKMACVLTLVLLEKKTNKIYYAHVGDTRLYLLRDQSLVKVTKDHSFVGLLEDSGRINEQDAMAHPKRNEINKALGFQSQISNPADFIESGESPFLPGDTILLCSDGLTDLVNRDGITGILSRSGTLAIKAQALVDAANDAGGKDNITVVLVQNSSTPVKLQATPENNRQKPIITRLGNVEDDTVVNSPSPVHSSSNRGWLLVLSLLCLLFLLAFLWLWNKDKTNINETSVAPTEKTVIPNPLQEIIDAATMDTLSLINTGENGSILIGGQVVIAQDSLILKGGNKTVISGDNSTRGLKSIIYIDSTAKYVLFDSITIRNADIIVNTSNFEAVHFNHVTLLNSRVEIAHRFSFSDTIFTGNILQMPGENIKPKRIQ